MSKSAAPPGYNSVSPYLTVDDVAASIDFMLKVFDGEEVERIIRPDGRIGHAEVRIGDSLILLGGNAAGATPRPAALYLYVQDTDATYARALAAGATSHYPPADTFHGDRLSAVIEAGGTLWWIATNKERLSQQEIQARADAHLKKA